MPVVIKTTVVAKGLKSSDNQPGLSLSAFADSLVTYKWKRKEFLNVSITTYDVPHIISAFGGELKNLSTDIGAESLHRYSQRVSTCGRL